MIGGVQFIHGANDGVATGSRINTELYRAFHNQGCFELSISQTGTNLHVPDTPTKTLTPEGLFVGGSSKPMVLQSYLGSGGGIIWASLASCRMPTNSSSL